MSVRHVARRACARAESGRPSRQTLEAMGLGSMVVMSDDDAMSVRGQGYKGGGSSVSRERQLVRHGQWRPDRRRAFGECLLGRRQAQGSGSNSSYAGVADIWISTGGGHKDKGSGEAERRRIRRRPAGRAVTRW